MGTDLNIGHVTAYAYAKSKGYTGTEEQFATELAQFAQNAQKVAEDKAAVEQLVDEFLNTTAPAVIQDVTDEGTSQVERVAGAGTAQVTRVGEAGNTQIDAVATAGTTQIGLVTAEGTTQVTRVQDKGDEVIDSIPADYTALTQEVSDLNRQLGYASNTFNYTNGAPHSSVSDVAYLPIRANETFKITVQTSVASNILITPFAYKADNTSDQLPYIEFSGGSAEKEYTASADYVFIGLYIGDSFESREVSFVVETENSILKVGALATLQEITFTPGFNVNYSNGDLMPSDGYKYAKIDVRLFQGGNISGTTAVFPDGNAGLAFKDADDNYITGYRNTTSGVYKWHYDVPIPQNAAYLYLPLRIQSQSDYVAPSFPWDVVVQNVQKMQGDINKAVTEAKEIKHKLDNARHIKGNTIAPLTLLHFSDLHNDRNALSRIMTDAENAGTLIDEKICTGDIVANTYDEISSWWDSSVLTCIGNHDTASYNSSTGYNWTALSMADRDAYYIAPFESGWGIIHTSGTSYYYKDYTTQKIRLIVMDAMLYTGTPGEEAIAQTAWLANLLSDAITSNFHVLVAIHSPHGGATAKECSFSRYNQSAMPTNSDCNTPQEVIDAVASAIASGLHFIGYLVGHTHQDNIWDAENDGKQLMYCITCAAVANQDQWKNSDQHRSIEEDAYNLVTIDTANTLVKIVRGGGADIDDHMRTRKAICFNYSTGRIVGEVL